jgi:hypothetical protein
MILINEMDDTLYAFNYTLLASAWAHLGNYDSALFYAEKSAVIDPLNPRNDSRY